MKRLLTAAALIPVIVYVVIFSNPWVFLAVVALSAILCYREFDNIASGFGFGAPGPIGFAMGLALMARTDDPWPWLLMVLSALIAVVLALRSPDIAHSLPRAALLVFGVVYIFGGWKCALPLREINRHWLMYALLVNWAGDTGAYYLGRAFGKHKLAPRVSPGKSWEGSIGSTLAALLVCVPYQMYFIGGMPLGLLILLTIVANAAGQMGDLAESAMKRGAGVKDSGALLPGHGGFLDRVDSTLFTLPVVYGYLRLLH